MHRHGVEDFFIIYIYISRSLNPPLAMTWTVAVKSG